ncbi:MAG: radical SAM family heme chaperone HemW [Ignavibacteriales bacterium]|nr:radical SAM family heme chaperone HemW [Ignavibacteriales bacterium]
MAGIYIHIPFCERKCIYCDFYSVEDHSLQSNFVSALIKEIELSDAAWLNETIETIYLGGGTPSVLSPDKINTILKIIRNRFKISEEPEVTIEINPGTIFPHYFQEYLSLGINRLSIGVQSFRDVDLQFLSRIHNEGEATETISQARKSGFDNIGIDLIYGLPTQSLDDWKGILRRAVEFTPEHISTYNLTVERQTPLFNMVQSGSVTIPDDDICGKMFRYAMRYLAESGYHHYEVSNYSLPNMASKHNSNYWTHKPYLGLGPSAHSYRNNVRWWNHRNINDYIDSLNESKAPMAESELLTRQQNLIEEIMFGLRMGSLDLIYLQNKFEIEIDSTQKLIKGMINENYIEYNGGTVNLTWDGFVFCDEIIKRFVNSLLIV